MQFIDGNCMAPCNRCGLAPNLSACTVNTSVLTVSVSNFSKSSRAWKERLKYRTYTFVAFNEFIHSFISYYNFFLSTCIIYNYYFLSVPQAQQKYNVATYYSGLVIGMAPLWVAFTSPLIGYLVRALAATTWTAVYCKFSALLQLPHLGLKFTQLAGLLLAGGTLILFGYCIASVGNTTFPWI